MQEDEEMEVLWPKESVPTKIARHAIDSYKLPKFLEHYKLGPKTWYFDVSKPKTTPNCRFFWTQT